MAASKRPTWRARSLGRKLRELRENKGLSATEVAEYLNVKQPTVNRYENGIFPVKSHDMESLLDLYGVNDIDDRLQMIRLAQSVTQRGWWEGYVDAAFADFVWAENKAETISEF